MQIFSADGRTDGGSTRGPRGPKKALRVQRGAPTDHLDAQIVNMIGSRSKMKTTVSTISNLALTLP